MTFLWSLCRQLWPPLRRQIKTPDVNEESNALGYSNATQNDNFFKKTTSMGASLAKWPEVLLPSLHKRPRGSTTGAEDSEPFSEGETRIEISWDTSKETQSSNQNATAKDIVHCSPETIRPYDSQTIRIFTPTTIKLDQNTNSDLAENQMHGAKAQVEDEELVPLRQMYSIEASVDLDVGWSGLDPDEILCATIPFASGASSQVYRGLYRNEQVVLKFITCTHEASFEKEFRRECRILQRIPQHEKIVKMYGVVGTCLVLEYCNFGSLFDLIHNPQYRLTPTKIKEILIDIAESMEVLHSRRIIHRDLKSGNLLVSSVGEDGREVVKLADFGLARNYLKNSTMTVGIGTWQYSSPEFFKNKKLTSKSDVYSFGVVLWELCTRKQPYYGRSFQEIFKCIVEKTDYSLKMPAIIDEQLVALYYKCVAMDPMHRPSFKEILTELYEINIS
eukprot:g391.t1